MGRRHAAHQSRAAHNRLKVRVKSFLCRSDSNSSAASRAQLGGVGYPPQLKVASITHVFSAMVHHMARLSLPSRPPCMSPSAYRNVCVSLGVSNRDKRHYLRAMAACANDVSCAKAVHQTEVRGKARTGPRVNDIFPDEGLGVLIEEVAFIKYLSPLFKMSVAKLRHQVNAMISYYEKREAGSPTNDSEMLAAKSFLRTSVPARSDGSIWLFRNPNRTRDPFDGLLNDWLGHRLGLNISATGENRLTFGFLAAHVDDVHRPTFLDTTWEYLEVWHYGGRTRPLPSIPAGLSGLEEVVALPPEIGRTCRSIVRMALLPR